MDESNIINLIVSNQLTDQNQIDLGDSNINSRTVTETTMDKFHTLMGLIDKHADVIPEGDYIEMSNLIRDLWKNVKPPKFLLDQNEPLTLPTGHFPTVSEITLALENIDNEPLSYRTFMVNNIPEDTSSIDTGTLTRENDGTIQMLHHFTGFTVTQEYRELSQNPEESV
tara:strand:+ start:9719 stop:10225 length:507 start_codon:yes stop_codon:yes gene_type:complete